MPEIQALKDAVDYQSTVFSIVAIILILREVRTFIVEILHAIKEKKNSGGGKSDHTAELVVAINSLKEHIKDWVSELHRGREAAAKSIESHFPMVMSSLSDIKSMIQQR